jgi:hypothetical protein
VLEFFVATGASLGVGEVSSIMAATVLAALPIKSSRLLLDAIGAALPQVPA